MQTALIGGAHRRLDAWKPSPLKMLGVKPSIDLASLPMTWRVPGFPIDYDQGQLGSCGPNSLAEVYEFLLGKKYSRLFAYWFTRATEGDAFVDSGVTIPDMIALAHSMGLPLETTWPYLIDRFEIPPSIEAVEEAVLHRADRTSIVVDLDHLLYELSPRPEAPRGQPVILGFGVPASMQDALGDTATTGVVRVPSSSDPNIGGHCVVAMGFDRASQLVRCTCHYGTEFGEQGTILLPFTHWSANNVNDATAIRSIS